MAGPRRGMEAVAFKSASKRRAALKRKGGMSVVIAIGKPSPKPAMEEEGPEDEAEMEECECPKCGHRFVPGDEAEDSGEGPESEEEMED